MVYLFQQLPKVSIPFTFQASEDPTLMAYHPLFFSWFGTITIIS